MAAMLLPEPASPHDADAIAVYMTGGHVGHVPGKFAGVLLPALTAMSASRGGRPCGCPARILQAGGLRIVPELDLAALGIDAAALEYRQRADDFSG